MNQVTESIRQRINLYLNSPSQTLQGLFSSGSYSYPFLGIRYFFSNPRLWPLYFKTIIPSFIIQLTVLISVFGLLFPFNVSTSILCCGPPVGLILGFNITLQESNFITNYILSNYLIPQPMNNLFDIILCNEGLYTLVIPGKLKRKVPVQFGDYITEEWIKFPFLTLPAITIRVTRDLVVYSLPIIGPFCKTLDELNQRGLKSQSRYFTLQQLRDSQIKYANKEQRGAFIGFAFISNLLESTPLPFAFGFFNFTNQIGAALMAVDFYKESKYEKII